MILSEKIRPIGINTDISPMSVEAGNDGNRAIINPVIDGLNRHYYTSENGAALRSENIKGTVLKSNSLPAGTNICIGTYEDQLNNKLIFWNYNSNGNHGVYAYSPETDTISTLIQVSNLAFQNDRRYLVTGAGSIGQLLYWSDGLNPQRVINMSRTYPYTGFDISHITLSKPQPYTKPTIGEYTFTKSPIYDRDYDSAIKTNLITGLNFQFSYRYKFLDNEYSTIAPLSEVSYGDYDQDPFNTLASFSHVLFNTSTIPSEKYTIPNKIRIRVTIPSTPQNFIKSVELLVSQNNLQTWSIFKIIQAPTGNIDEYFTAAEALTALAVADTSKLFEAIPNYSKALVVHKNRVFVSTDQEGFDVNDSPTISINQVPFNYVGAIHLGSTITFAAVGSITTITVPGGNYQIGETIVFSDNNPPILPSVYLYARVVAINGGGSFDFQTFYNNVGGGVIAIINPYVNQIHFYNSGGTFRPSDVTKTYWKTNAIHQFGIAVFDAQQRCMGIISKTTYNVPSTAGGSILNTFIACSNDILLSASLSGNFSTTPKAAYYSLCVTKDQNYATYQQMAVRVLFYKFEQPSGYSPAAGEFALNGKIFVSTPTTKQDFNKIYLMLPRENSLVLDNTFYVRPLSGFSGKIERINQVTGNFLVVGNFNISDADIVTLTSPPSLIAYTAVVEIFKPQTSNDGLFYEITDRYSIDGSGNMSVTSFSEIQGFNYRNINKCTDYIPVSNGASGTNTTLFSFNPYSSFTNIFVNVINTELPTPITSQSDITLSDKGNTIFYSRILNPDYTKIADNRGKLIVEITEKKAFARTSVIRFSNSYVQDTNINGLSNFNSANQYSLPYERGDITKIVTVGNRLLVVHKFNSTVVYTNENVVTKADGSQDLIASSAVVAYDRALQDGGFGCYHAESIAQIEGQVFAYDIYKGVVWRYTEAGQFPISNYGRKEYFRTKSKTYLPNKDSVKIIGGVDPFNKEYIITFNDGTGASETLAFNYEKEKWTTRYSFIPEYYGKINNKLISFKNGALWVHNESSTYNNFYGVQYTSFLKLAVNPHPSWVKAFMGIDLAIEAISSDIDFKQIEVSTEEGQYSYIKSDEFEKHENVFYANILKDVNTPPATLNGALALRAGDDMRSKYILLQVNDDQITKNSMQFINLAYTRSEYSE